MLKGESVLAVISARGGSKGIPQKNLQMLHEHPLIAWTIRAALQSESIDRCIVSSDDPDIMFAASEYGADVPFQRPAHLAHDDTPGIAPVLHALEKLPGYDWVVLLQPTSPFRTAGDIDAAIQQCARAQKSSIVSVCPVSETPYWMYWQSAEGELKPVVDKNKMNTRQQLPPVMRLNGALYIARVEWLLQTKTFLTEETMGFEMPVEASLDIDEPGDLAIARARKARVFA